MNPLHSLETLITDQYFRFRKPHLIDSDVLIVGVDAAGVSLMEDSPSPAGVHIELLTRLAEGHPKVIVYSLQFKQSTGQRIAEFLKTNR